MVNYDPAPNLPSATPQYIISLIRTAVVAVGGWLVGKGYVTAEQVPQIAGGAIALGGALYGLWKAHHDTHKLKDAIMAPEGSAK